MASKQDFEVCAKHLNKTFTRLTDLKDGKTVIDLHLTLHKQIGFMEALFTICAVFSETNPRFDRNKFLRTCLGKHYRTWKWVCDNPNTNLSNTERLRKSI